ncbi:MAG: glycoside hydrolase family 127 protein [Treponema sp.]|jgi:DUF1680 family protein|nr:glycoside hydrolase family 127 protein [Treponema sp.]
MDNARHTEFIGLKKVVINDGFWTAFMERIRTQVIPYQWEALNDRIPSAEPSYCVRNFKLAAELTHPELDYGVPRDIGHGGCVFQDSDFAKWIEAAAYSLVWRPDPDLEKTLDHTIDIICNAQQSDGYLDTYYIINGMDKRFTNLKDNHELYCFGHLLEGAIAYYEATGKRKLMDALIRYADCVDRNIGPEEGKVHGYPGHELAEMALVRLYAITKDEKHLKLAHYFIDERGKRPYFFALEECRNNGNGSPEDAGEQYHYHQAHKPVREQRVAEGHAVRAMYLYAGMADLARLTNDKELIAACEALFANVSKRQMYITGGIGQSAYGEAFSYDYSLPNDTVYAETCAAIGLAFFARRMSAIAPRGVYADVLEKTLYNGIISGMSLDGKTFFYVNPLEALPEACLKDQRMSHVRIERQKWFGCACCPPNLARIIASLGSYIHSENAGAVYTHLYVGSEAKASPGGTDLTISIETNYPWEGLVNIRFNLKEAARFRYGLRIPGWCRNYALKLNGADAAFTVEDAYAVFNREWKDGDSISAAFDMPVTFVQANPKVREDVGKTAVMRGPVVYCLEEADNGKELCRLHVGQAANISVKYEKALLEGVTLISMTGKREKDWAEDELYRAIEDSAMSAMEDKTLRFIPYYAWTNRSPGEMTVWVNR